jgi:hypothetical protein
MNDPRLYRNAYLQRVRRSRTDDDLDVALPLLENKDGRQWYEMEKP